MSWGKEDHGSDCTHWDLRCTSSTTTVALFDAMSLSSVHFARKSLGVSSHAVSARAHVWPSRLTDNDATNGAFECALL